MMHVARREDYDLIMKPMKELITYLEDEVKNCKHLAEDLNVKNWYFEIGVLISANEASRIIGALKSLNKG